MEKDTDVIKFFNILSNIKEEELKIEYERIKSSNDKNKEGLFLKIMEDIFIQKESLIEILNHKIF